MTTQEKILHCETLVHKVTTGEPLNEAEKTHLANCEHCIAEMVRTLDGTVCTEVNGDRPNAQTALKHGRRVFEREFGIMLSKD